MAKFEPGHAFSAQIRAGTDASTHLQMRVEHPTHFRDVVVFTVQLLVPLVHAELPLAGADGRGARAVVAERGRHGQGLHSGLPSQRRFTCPGRHTASHHHGDNSDSHPPRERAGKPPEIPPEHLPNRTRVMRV